MPTAAGVVHDFQIHQRLALRAGGGQRLLDGRLHQRLRQRGRRVVAGRGFARVAGAFQIDVALFHADFAQCLEAFFFAQDGTVVGVEIRLDGFAARGGGFVFEVHGGFGGPLKAELQQPLVDAPQVGDAHVLKVAPHIKQRGAPVGFVEQLF